MRLVCWAAGISLTCFPFPPPFVLPKRLRGNMRPPTPIRGRERKGGRDLRHRTPPPFVVRGTLAVGGGFFTSFPSRRPSSSEYLCKASESLERGFCAERWRCTTNRSCTK